MGATRAEEAAELSDAPNVASRTALRATFHLRRYMPLYVFASLWAVMIALFPTIDHTSSNNGGGNTGSVLSSGGQIAGNQALGTQSGVVGSSASGSAAGSATSTPGAGAAASGSYIPSGSAVQSADTSGRAAGGGPSAPVGTVAVGSGVTIDGTPCSAGVRQVAYSAYAPPCVAKFTGNNGGATARGVTASTIKFDVRVTSDQGGPNAAAVDQASKAAGQGTSADNYGQIVALLPYFQRHYELYGRKVELQKFNGQGNGTSEAQSQGQAAACADATAIAQTDKAFGEFGYGTSPYETGPFTDCAAQQKLFVPFGAPYFPERDFRRWDPYAWGGITECERISHDVAEYSGKRLLNRKAKWAGSAVYQSQNRVFGTYVPNNDDYQYCVNISESDFKNKYGGKISSRYNYALDVSQFPAEAARGVLQFKSAGVTTLTLACDPISQIFLTQAAKQQQWNPEWFIIGVAAQDTDGYGRLYDQSEVDGHMFGMSQLGSDRKVNDPNGEAAKAWAEISHGQKLPAGAGLIYYYLVQLFSQLQAAGPNLTIQNLAYGTRHLPVGGGASGAVGTWSFATSHTAIVDAREVYWSSSAVGYDGSKGTYLEANGGRRYQSGQWTTDSPPIYQGH